jgi:hypothetical protein
MSTSTVKLIINNANIPLVYEQAGRDSLAGQDASARMPNSYVGDYANADYGQAEILYAENVLPYAKGIYSVGFAQQTQALSGGLTTADQCIQLRDVNENIRSFVPAAGANYVYNTGTSTWSSISSFSFTGSLVTRAYVAGRTFICYEKARIIEYNTGTGLFDTIALTYPPGVTIANVRGIGAASNYLLFFTDFGVYWCSPLNLLEFSDINQGAGNQTPADIKGQITAILNVSGGAIIYTARNAIGVTYTNNAATPFVFKEINNAGGVANWEHVTPEADETGHYIYGTNGLQLVGLSRAVTLFPEITDFLTGGQVETWNSSTKTVDRSNSAAAFSVKLAFLSGRFLVISYGPGTTNFSYALIYDTALKRWGKIKLDHVDAFTYGYAAGTGSYTYDTLTGNYDEYLVDYAALGLFYLAVTPPKQGMAFLQANGVIQILQPQFIQTLNSGVMIIGRIQTRHGRKTTMQFVDIDGVKTPNAPTVTLLPSQSGLDRDTPVAMTLFSTTGNQRRYNKRLTAENIDVAIEGTFVLSSFLATVSQHGSR